MTKEYYDKRIDLVFKHRYLDGGAGFVVAPKHVAWTFFDEIYNEFAAERDNCTLVPTDKLKDMQDRLQKPHGTCSECKYYKQFPEKLYGFCTINGETPIDSEWYCAGWKIKDETPIS